VTRWHGLLLVVNDAALSRDKMATVGRQPSRRPPPTRAYSRLEEEGFLPPPPKNIDEEAPDLGEVASKGASALAGEREA
jgi:hypothetical protein